MHDPPWYQMGIANLLNGVAIRSDGSVLLNRNLQFEPRESDKRVKHETYDLPRLLRAGAFHLNQSADYESFLVVAREWAQFGLLTTDQHRKQYRDLALLMQQGVPAEDAVKDAFGTSLEQLTKEFGDRSWHNQVQFRLVAPKLAKPLPTPAKLDSAEAERLLQVLALRAKRNTPDPM